MTLAARIAESRLVQRNKVALQGAFSRLGLDVHVRSDASFDLLAFARARGARTLVDVGANVGQFASAARRDGWRGTIVSFEPSSGAFAHLQRNSSSDDAWYAIRGAVGAEPGEITLNVSHNSTSSSTLTVNDRHVATTSSAAIDHQETVPLVRLDEALADVSAAVPPYLLKVDVQGAENAVLDGAGLVLDNTLVLQVETSLAPLYDGAVHWLELARRIEGMGFVIVDIEPAYRSSDGVLLQADVVFARS